MGAAVIEKFVEGGTYSTAGIEHIVYQNDMTSVDVEGQVGRFNLGVHALVAEVIPMKGNVQIPQGLVDA